MKALLAVVGFCAAVTAVLGFLGYLPKIVGFIKAVYYRTPVGTKRFFYKKLRLLSPDVQLDYFSRSLGLTPVFRNKRALFSEYVYVHPLFYVQALVDEQDSVACYSVTSRTRGFEPRIWPHNLHPETVPMIPNPRLGSFSLGELDIQPQEIEGWVGARRFGYVEAFYTGNPGLYRTYFVGINDAGPADTQVIRALNALIPHGSPIVHVDRSEDWEDVERFLERPDVSAFRETAKPNTYGVSMAHFRWEGESDFRIPPIGPNADQVRTLNE